jgi:ABC-type transport system involved in cytochrome bd biosynthesis fused ATPase/permease subunit
VSFTVQPSRTVAVVGPTGSGKSTVTSLLVRRSTAQRRCVLDGVNARLRGGRVAATAAWSQQAFLFDDTVRDNVTLGMEVPDDEVGGARAGAGRRLRGLAAGRPGHPGRRAGHHAVRRPAAAGALARALVRRPNLLVLDDATSSVDPAVEARILAGLRESAATVVVVAYRRATIALADEVIYVEHGRVLDRGRPDELAQRSVGFHNLLTAYEDAARRIGATPGRLAHGRDRESVADMTAAGTRRRWPAAARRGR